MYHLFNAVKSWGINIGLTLFQRLLAIWDESFKEFNLTFGKFLLCRGFYNPITTTSVLNRRKEIMSGSTKHLPLPFTCYKHPKKKHASDFHFLLKLRNMTIDNPWRKLQKNLLQVRKQPLCKSNSVQIVSLTWKHIVI